jgi:hypothetical protein
MGGDSGGGVDSQTCEHPAMRTDGSAPNIIEMPFGVKRPHERQTTESLGERGICHGASFTNRMGETEGWFQKKKLPV